MQVDRQPMNGGIRAVCAREGKLRQERKIRRKERRRQVSRKTFLLDVQFEHVGKLRRGGRCARALFGLLARSLACHPADLPSSCFSLFNRGGGGGGGDLTGHPIVRQASRQTKRAN